MNPHALRVGLITTLLLAGCGGAMENEPPPPLPPPPPAAPPLDSVSTTAPAPEAESSVPVRPQSPPPSPPVASGSTQAPAGPLPALPSQAPRYAPTAPPADEAPPATEWVRAGPQGQWVYTSDYGWVWVPAGAVASDVEGVPYAYLYTPQAGWTWYLSPWGGGPYFYGRWVRHPWHPRGWHGGWVAHPRVVVRLGGHHWHGHR